MLLARSQKKAIEVLLPIPRDAELNISNIDDQELWLGCGWLVGRQWAVYCGDSCFALTSDGRSHAENWLKD